MDMTPNATLAAVDRLRGRARAAVSPWWPWLAACAIIDLVAAPLDAARVSEDLQMTAIVLAVWLLVPRVIARMRGDDDRHRAIVPNGSRYRHLSVIFMLAAAGYGLAYLLDTVAPHRLIAPIWFAVLGLLTWSLLGWRERSIPLVAFAVTLAGVSLAEPFIHPAVIDALAGAVCLLVTISLRAAERRAVNLAS